MKHFVLLFLLFVTYFGFAKSWQVGSGANYKMPSAVAALVQDGDTINIAAETYSGDVAYWKANNLLIRGIGGMAKLTANGKSYGGKAIWVIGGNNTTIQSIEFADCTVKDQNGAGIRLEGKNLSVIICYFYNNDNGILAGAIADCKIKIEYCEFAYNGFGDGYSHNLYIGNIDTLIFQSNYSHHAKIGHELKSRAKVNHILYNRISDEATGTASRNIDLPNGGMSIILGNFIEQGPKTENSNIIGYGLEGLSNANSELYVVNNTIVNNRNAGNFIHVQNATPLLNITNNIFAGQGSLLLGTSNKLDSSSNLQNTVISNFNFIDAALYDYSLKSTSMAVNTGINPGKTNDSFDLKPYYNYNHPVNITIRNVDSKIDIGADEFIGVDSYKAEEQSEGLSILFGERINVISDYDDLQFEINDLKGSISINGKLNLGDNLLNISNLQNGIYFLQIIGKDIKKNYKFLK